MREREREEESNKEGERVKWSEGDGKWEHENSLELCAYILPTKKKQNFKPTKLWPCQGFQLEKNKLALLGLFNSPPKKNPGHLMLSGSLM